MYHAQTDNSSVMFKTAEIYNFIITPHMHSYKTFSNKKILFTYVASILYNVMKNNFVFPLLSNVMIK